MSMIRRRMPARLASAMAVLVAVTLCLGINPAGPVMASAPCALSATLQQGSKTAQVVCLESTLRALGFTSVAGPDSYFGTSTTAAVRWYQAQHGLVADGIVGPRTRAALGLGAPAAPAATVAAHIIEKRLIGTSVQGRPITAVRMGTPGGRVVMVVGIIHGDETKGALITALLRTLPTPAGIDLWLVDTMNPDGQANGTRTNANGVDLNRNFETGWSYIPRSTTNHQYSGEAPDDQPETQAMEAFIRSIRPAIGIWYHQDANVISVNGARHIIPATYGRLVGLGTGSVPCSQKCTGTAGTFANAAIAGSTNFLVELPGSALVTTAMIRLHATAVGAVITL
jgi:protein MpaA